MDLEARLRAFAAVARRGSFSRAAEELAISQPAVSKHVADLETALGTRLLIREPRGARLTEAGEFLAGYLSRAEALLAQAAAGVASIASADSGTVRVAASGTPGVYLLPKALAAFAVARPGVDLQVIVGTSAEAMEAVRNHRAELGLVGGATSAPDLELEPLVEDEVILVGPRSFGGRELTAREIERETWISREEGSATRQAVEGAMANLGLRPARRLTLPDWEMIKIAVASGAGVAAISRLATDSELADGRLVRLHVPGWHVVRPLSIIRSRDVPMTPLAAHLTATLRRVLGSTGSEAREPSTAQTG
jgi:DNA-binding transcriptional LysR family regulator